VNKTFAHHKPSATGLERIARLREAYSTLSDVVSNNAGPSRERSLAITALEESAMWAIKAVVHNDPGSEIEGQ
jgi:hypothetical protein